MRAIVLAAVALLAAATVWAQAGDPKAAPQGGTPAPSAAATLPAPAQPASPLPTVTASLDTTATSVGGRLHLRLDVDAAEGWVVEPPATAAELGVFRVRSIEPGVAAGGRHTFTLTLVPTEAGEVEVPPVTMRARRGGEEPVEIASSPVRVHVASNLGAAEAPSDSAGASAEAKLADLKPAIVPPRDWRPVWIAAVAAVLAFAAAYALLRRLRRRPVREVVSLPPPLPARPAWEIALEELDRIAAERLVDRGELRRQYEEVTEALRRYLENRWGVPALESTTDDVRRLLESAPVPPSFASRVTALLSEADLVKFAKARPEPHAARACETRARELVVETIPREQKAEEAA